MKIMHAVSVARTDGENIRLASLLSGLSERFEIELMAPEGSALFPMLRGTRVKQIPIRSEGNRDFSLTDVYKMQRVMRSERPDAVHSHASRSARAAARMCGVSCLVSECGGSVPPALRRSLSPAARGRRGEYTVLASEILTGELISRGASPSRIAHLGCGAPELALSGDGEGVTVTAKCLCPDEYRLVISAAARAARAADFRTLLFVPEGARREALRAAALFSSWADIEIRPLSRLSEYLPSRNTLFVYPVLRDERLPILPMRFMSASLPLAVSATAANREFFTEGSEALFFIPGDPFSLAECILRIISDEALWNKLSHGARAAWESRYSSEKMLEEYGNFYLALGGAPSS